MRTTIRRNVNIQRDLSKVISETRCLKILIVVSGGVVQSVIACDADGKEFDRLALDVVLQDYDNAEGEGQSEEQADMDTWFEDGQTVRDFFEQKRLGNPNYKDLPY